MTATTTMMMMMTMTNSPEKLGKLIDDGRDESLHGAELRVQPQEHQHEEEAAAPERGEGHLQHGAGVGQEGETRPWAHPWWILGRYFVDTRQILGSVDSK